MIHSNEKNRTQGFTIVELIVITIIIVILATITIVSYGMVTNDAKQQAVETDAQTIAAQLTKYKSKNGAYPDNLNTLTNAPGTQSTYKYTYNAGTGTYCLTASTQGASAFIESGSTRAKQGACSGH